MRQRGGRDPVRSGAQWGTAREQQTEPEGGRGEANEEKKNPSNGVKRREERKTTSRSSSLASAPNSHKLRGRLR